MMRLIQTLVLAMLYIVPARGQGALYLESFEADVRGQSILLQWVTQKGFTCEDVIIEYSTDTFQWNEIHKIPGICGSEQERKEYSYIFNEAKAGKINYFRIDLGVFGYSEVLRVAPVITGIAVAPNPLTESTVVYLVNPFREEVQVELAQLDGKVLLTKNLGTVSQFHFRDLVWPNPGIYTLLLTIGDAEPKYIRISVSE